MKEPIVSLLISEYNRLLDIERAYKVLVNWTTEKQKKYLDYFEDYKKENWFYPTYKIAWEYFWKHPSVVHSVMRKAKLKWLITK